MPSGSRSRATRTIRATTSSSRCIRRRRPRSDRPFLRILFVADVFGALDPFESPFLAADRLVEEARSKTPVVVVDFHAEATSEKVALARYLDGRVTAVLGTHTHVQTNDARILAGGTAAITDAGMTGPHDSVIGSVGEGASRPFGTGMPGKLQPAADDVRIEGALVVCTADGRATSCVPVRVQVEE